MTTPKEKEEKKNYLEGFCGVCQKHFTTAVQSEWPIGAFTRAKEELAWLTIHANHKLDDKPKMTKHEIGQSIKHAMNRANDKEGWEARLAEIVRGSATDNPYTIGKIEDFIRQLLQRQEGALKLKYGDRRQN